MKSFNKKQTIYFSCMTASMILADILICFTNNYIAKIGLGMLLAVAIFAVLFYQETKKLEKKKEEELLKKILK